MLIHFTSDRTGEAIAVESSRVLYIEPGIDNTTFIFTDTSHEQHCRIQVRESYADATVAFQACWNLQQLMSVGYAVDDKLFAQALGPAYKGVASVATAPK